ncbi:ABC transporter related protein [Thermotoga petrophila RKU-10]|jgi:ABC-type sugar transport system ATPase subunit|uniref:Autoinducer 2 import ATP-binding protein LsrA n=1 Tax=Thermotoga petrophila (strain ATCC BAA-489 / DSM 13996 / JCM 10882 / RKU-10) TaxID=590168 RepID=D2C4W3_THEP2|nr:sugar ABC transporter ATP-binding protein [Thermotoga petrophila]ADA67767.1 ABC transporter related protein [Thermotoga petrophila RKU-10]
MPILEVRNISKSFPGVKALKNVNFSLEKGEVHAILGENGAGKSTLVKIIQGIYQPDSGEVFLEGEKVIIKDANHARSLGIIGIPQEVSIFPDLTVLENLFIGWEPKTSFGFINKKDMIKIANQKMKELNIDLPLEEEAGRLSTAQQKLIQILKSLIQKAKILIMDEPTTSLTTEEIEALFGVIEKLKASGVSIIYISHRLEEVFRIADKVTVLRDGEVVYSDYIKNVTPEVLVEKMIGRKLNEYFPKRDLKEHKDVLLRLENIKFKILEKINLTLFKGEILGIAGLLGSGRTTLAKIITGFLLPEEGKIYLKGKEIHFSTPYDAIRNGVVYIPEDRRTQGLILQETVRFNLSLPNLDILPKKFIVDVHEEYAVSRKLISNFSIKVPDPDYPVFTLSGGNQQKVVLAKWLFREPEVVVFDEPTVGIDVGTKSNIYHLMASLSDKGKGVIFISSDFSELVGVCDRILILKKGKIIKEISRTDKSFSEHRIFLEAAGINHFTNKEERI